MNKILEIEVTQEDILNGTKSSPTTCPIALAIKRQIKNVVYVSVGGTTVNLVTKKMLFLKSKKDYHLDRTAQDFIFSFDQDFIPVHPFTFLMEKLNW